MRRDPDTRSSNLSLDDLGIALVALVGLIAFVVIFAAHP